MIVGREAVKTTPAALPFSEETPDINLQRRESFSAAFKGGDAGASRDP